MCQKTIFLLATQVRSLSVRLHNLFHTESDNTLCFVKQVHNGTNVFMKSHLNRYAHMTWQDGYRTFQTQTFKPQA